MTWATVSRTIPSYATSCRRSIFKTLLRMDKEQLEKANQLADDINDLQIIADTLVDTTSHHVQYCIIIVNGGKNGHMIRIPESLRIDIVSAAEVRLKQLAEEFSRL